MGMVGGGIWIVATVKATTSQLVKTVEDLTASVKGLTARIDSLEHDHAETQARIAQLEGGK
jgi:prefoldin subunit 5